MQIGDRVRFLHSKDEGVIKRFLDSNQVEVEIEDGFLIPVVKAEIVKVAQEETDRFHRGVHQPQKETPTQTGPIVTEGIFVAFEPFNDKILSTYIINTTDLQILFTYSEIKGTEAEGIYSGIIEKRSFTKIGELRLNDFESWPEFAFNFIFFSRKKGKLKAPLSKTIKFKANSFFKNKKRAPLLNKDAYTFPIDQQAISISTEEIVEKIFTSKEDQALKNNPLKRPPGEIDLHIEKLTTNYSSLSSGEILEIQLTSFENHLANAIATGMEEIIFIHGVGNGILRTNIHKKLSNNKDIKFFNDAQKEKFGYGATYIKFK